MNTPNYAGAWRSARDLLARGLAPALTYHHIAHTCSDVVPAAARLARLSGISIPARKLLLTAAWFHDVGFTEQRAGHEAASVQIARAVLPTYGFSTAQISAIATMIMATRLPQSPQSQLDMLLADADLDSLGRPDFLHTSLALHAELCTYGAEISLPEWYAQQRHFLEQHRYFSPAAHQLRDAGKRHNIQLLAHLVEYDALQ